MEGMGQWGVTGAAMGEAEFLVYYGHMYLPSGVRLPRFLHELKKQDVCIK